MVESENRDVPEGARSARSSGDPSGSTRGAIAAFCLLLIAGAIGLTILDVFAGWDDSILPVTLGVAVIALILARFAIR